MENFQKSERLPGERKPGHMCSNECIYRVAFTKDRALMQPSLCLFTVLKQSFMFIDK